MGLFQETEGDTLILDPYHSNKHLTAKSQSSKRDGRANDGRKVSATGSVNLKAEVAANEVEHTARECVRGHNGVKQEPDPQEMLSLLESLGI